MSLIIEGYVVETLIKEGGFGGVYRAKRVIDKKTLALKVLNPKGAKQMSARTQFYREARLLAHLDHPYIVKVYGMVPQSPRPAIAMEYFESSTLHSLILNQSPLLQQKGLKIFREISEALQYLHGKKILHKDIKPENMLVSAEGDARLIDFSIAEKQNFFSFLRFAKREGTPLYMSPEQIKRERLDCRTDIYSLGAAFYQAFCGKPHITAESAKAILKQQLTAPIAKMRQFNKQIPYQLDAIILRMLRKKRADRYQSIAEMLFELKRFSMADNLVKSKEEDPAE